VPTCSALTSGDSEGGVAGRCSVDDEPIRREAVAVDLGDRERDGLGTEIGQRQGSAVRAEQIDELVTERIRGQALEECCWDSQPGKRSSRVERPAPGLGRWIPSPLGTRAMSASPQTTITDGSRPNLC
jgi:hypothetical protein